MKVRRWIGPAFLMLGLFCLTVAGNGQDLEWKVFKDKDKSFYQTIKTVTVQELKVGEATLKQKQEQTFWIKWTSKGVEKDKLTLIQNIYAVKMDLDIGGNKITYETDKDAAKNPMTQFFKALEKAEFELIIDTSKNKVTEVKGLDKLVTELVKVNKAFEPALKVILSKENVQTLSEPIFAMIPDKGKIPEKKTWTSDKVVLSMGGLGKYTTENTYTSEGEEKDGAKKGQLKIKVEPKVSYEPPPASDKDAKADGLPFKIKEGKLTTQKASGYIYWNKDKGRLESSDLHVEVNGELKVSIASSDATVGLSQTQDTSVLTSDDDPRKKK